MWKDLFSLGSWQFCLISFRRTAVPHSACLLFLKALLLGLLFWFHTLSMYRQAIAQCNEMAPLRTSLCGAWFWWVYSCSWCCLLFEILIWERRWRPWALIVFSGLLTSHFTFYILSFIIREQYHPTTLGVYANTVFLSAILFPVGPACVGHSSSSCQRHKRNWCWTSQRNVSLKNKFFDALLWFVYLPQEHVQHRERALSHWDVPRLTHRDLINQSIITC